jgi:phospholipid/cholesterol/gamma-HCH transport system substrate-binding protein
VQDGRERSTLRGSGVARVVAIVALVAALVVVGLLVFGGGPSYTVTAAFQNASQLVTGNQVVVAGVPAGSVEDITLGPHGQAMVKFSVDSDYAPLKAGTTAQIRSTSLSSVAGRQVELTLPPSNSTAPNIPDGGAIPLSQTTSEVDLDQVFNTLSPKTVKDFKHVIEGFDISYEGSARQANQGFRYLNPLLSTSRRVFDQLTRNTPILERLLVNTSSLSGALAQRAPAITELVHNLDLTMNALARQKLALAATIHKLPGFMREANTTFVNLRAALNDLDPLVSASKPVADRLQPWFHVLRRTAHDAVPTITDLQNIIRRPGSQNDLIELTRDAVPLAKAGVGSGSPTCGANPSIDYEQAADNNFTQGALGESLCALRNGLPPLAFFRPYTPELVGWFNDFGTSGVTDANGGVGRIESTLNPFSFSTPGFPLLTQSGVLTPSQILATLDTNNARRCPGNLERTAEDGSNPFTDGGNLTAGPTGCQPKQTAPVGP